MMTSIGEKAAYVTAQPQTRQHHCHWPGCKAQVPPALWGCRHHWYRLPRALRTKIWHTYDIGQEIAGTPSMAYVAVASEVQTWIAAYEQTQSSLFDDKAGGGAGVPPAAGGAG